MIMMMTMMMTTMTNTIPYRRTKTHIWDKVLMGIWVHPIIITMIIMMITGDPRGCGQVPTDTQQQGDPHNLGGRDFKSAAVKVPFLIIIIKKPTPF